MKRSAFEQDAPGWSGSSMISEESSGPVCWHCKGAKSRKAKMVVEGSKKRVLVDKPCGVCKQLGFLPKKQKETSSAGLPGRVSKRKRPLPQNWECKGPLAAKDVSEVDLLEGEELCSLLGHWKIFQRIGGHRWSSDDLVTAWAAGQAWKAVSPVQAPLHCLDLGCGIGTVLLMVAWQFHEQNPFCLGLEAQERSVAMARRSINFNGCSKTVKVEQGDIREFDQFHKFSPDGKFDLVTGTPPYFPVKFDSVTGRATPGIGGLPTCQQAAPARYEFRGGIEGYCAAAAPRLRSPASRFIVCEGNLDENHPRVLASAAANELTIVTQISILGRDDKPPLFAVYVMKLKTHDEAETKIETLTIRHKGGKRSEAYNSLMGTMGIPPG